MRIDYVVGWGRSGSTLLGDLLGQVEGHVHVGELRSVFKRGVLERRLCGCGEPIIFCPIWRVVLKRVLDTSPDSLEGRREAERIVTLQNSALRVRHIPGHKVTTLMHRQRPPSVRDYSETIQSTYRAIVDVTGATTVVDTSKVPVEAMVIRGEPAIEARYIHLVRDPRATAHSWTKPKKEIDNPEGHELMPEYGVLRSTLRWGAINLLAEFLRRDDEYVFVRYEDLVRDPVGTLMEAGKITRDSAAFASADRLNLGPTHSISGNPSRAARQNVKIALDDRWRTELSSHHRFLVKLLTWPLMKRYGYE